MSSTAVVVVGAPSPASFLLSSLPHKNPPSFLSLSTPSRHFCLTYSSPPLHSQNPRFISSNNVVDEEDEEEEEEQVIGDCLVFEDGIFEDPFVQQEQNTPQVSSIEPESLVPEEWKQAVEEINLTKKERRKIAQEFEFGAKIEKKKRDRKVNFEEYLRFKNEKLAQLNPVVLDTPTEFAPKNDVLKGESDGVQYRRGGFSRVEPRNPRWAVYGRGLDDVSEFFNSGTYQPSDDGDDKSQGRQKLFTREEKVLMNAKIPKLAVATSQKWHPLHTLAASGEFYHVNNLLKYEVDINAADVDGLTALHKAITGKKHAVINYLLRESANPFVRDKDGATLMHYAVRTASCQAIKTLLLHNVDINLQDNDGWTPLHLAVQTRRTDVVMLLLIRGADKTLKNKDGSTALELCLHSGRDTKTFELIKLLKQLPRQRR